jgi:hypothetical protein
MSASLTPEGKVKLLVKQALFVVPEPGDLYGWWPVPGGYGENSLDYVGCHKGAFFAIETKAPNGKLSALQANSILRIRACGGTAFVIDGTDRYPLKPLIDWLSRA